MRDKRLMGAWALLAGVWALALLGCGSGPSATPAAGPRNATASARGVELSFEDHPGPGPVVVFIHGWACDRTFWRAQVPALEGRRRLLLLDLPGHGLSAKPEVEYSVDFFAAATLAAMDAARVDRAVLVGHSLGFAVARAAALAQPQRVLGLVSVDGVLERDYPDPAAARQAMAETARFLEAMRADPQGTTTAFVESFFTNATAPGLRQEVLGKMLATPAQVRLSVMEHVFDPALWKLRPLDLPALGVYSDLPYLPVDFPDFFKAHFPKAELDMWPGHGHFLHLEDPERLNARLAEFVGRIR